MSVFRAKLFGISILAPTRGATITTQRQQISWAFQSSLPRGERRHWQSHLLQDVDFNPRSHEGSDTFTTWGYADRVISILAPTRGATYGGSVTGTFWLHFNPRSHEGSDLLLDCQPGDIIISILAPTRGATWKNHVNSFFWRFQSSLPRGERLDFSLFAVH